MVISELKLSEGVRGACRRIAEVVKRKGGRALCVGGAVRDSLVGEESKDLDIEVYGVEQRELERLLRREFNVVKVGKSFCVYKLRDVAVDVSLPRRESKVGLGHRGFEVEGDPWMSYEEAASRRDFTVNAIYCDLLSGEVIDPWGGVRDLREGVLRKVSEKFKEDPLRVLRGMQMVARFDLEVEEGTMRSCREMGMETLTKERVFEEWKKLLVKGKRISKGMEFLRESGWVRYYPEVEALIGCEQDPIWHPEGDAWVHTLMCLDGYAGERVGDEREDLVVGLGVLLHDVGKPKTTYRDEEGRVRSPRHDIEGVAIARGFLERITEEKGLIEEVLVLVETHMRPGEIMKTGGGLAAVRRLMVKVGKMERLERVVRADMKGKLGYEKEWGMFEAGVRDFKRKIEEILAVEGAPRPIIKGRHLIGLGMKPGLEFTGILDVCFEAQLDGKFRDEEGGMKYLRELVGR